MSVAEHCIKASFAARGYAVVAFLRSQQIGTIIEGVNICDADEFRHPFRVTQQTDRADYEQQCELGDAPKHLNREYAHFYRVETD